LPNSGSQQHDYSRVKLASLYPLRGLPGQRQLWSWISFDVANQSFALIINTLLFSVFFTEVVVRNPAIDDRLWSITNATAMLLVVLASPIAGAISDARAWKKRCLVGSGFIAAGLTCALALIGPGQFWLACLIYIPASFMCSIGDNFLGSFLPEVSARENFGRVSGFSWAVAYTAALLLLAITAATMVLFNLGATDACRPFFVFAGVWFFAFAIPTLLWLQEKAPPAAQKSVNVWTAGFRRLAESAHHLTRFRDVATLLVASLFYGAGMNVIIFFASILAREFGFAQVQLVLFIAVITVSGIVGTLIPTWWQDRLGHRRTTMLLLGVWLATTAGLMFFTYQRAHAPDPAAFPTWPIWLFGNLLGFGLGSLGAANRAFFGYLTPATRTGEFFGLWGLVFKLAALLTIPFAIAKDKWGTPTALGVLLTLIAIGAGLTLLIDERRGLAAARAEDAAAGGEGMRPDSM
jgi:UMF1 family MFS transporter